MCQGLFVHSQFCHWNFCFVIRELESETDKDCQILFQIGRDTLEDEFTGMLERDKTKKDRDPILDTLKSCVKEEGMKKHEWDEKAEDSLVNLVRTRIVLS